MLDVRFLLPLIRPSAYPDSARHYQGQQPANCGRSPTLGRSHSDDCCTSEAAGRPIHTTRPMLPFKIRSGSDCNGVDTGHGLGNPVERQLSDSPSGCCRRIPDPNTSGGSIREIADNHQRRPQGCANRQRQGKPEPSGRITPRRRNECQRMTQAPGRAPP